MLAFALVAVTSLVGLVIVKNREARPGKDRLFPTTALVLDERTVLHEPDNGAELPLIVEQAEAFDDDSIDVQREEYAPSDPGLVHVWLKTNSLYEIPRTIDAENNVLTQRDERGLTALHWVARLGRRDVLQLLIEKGANLEARSSHGRFSGETPLAFLMDYLARPLGKNPSREDREDVRSSIARGFMMSDTELPLVYCEIAQDLIDAGAVVDARDDNGRTPLMKAVIGGHEGIVNVLIRAGANPNITDNFGKTALELGMDTSASDAIIGKVREAMKNKRSRSTHKSESGTSRRE